LLILAMQIRSVVALRIGLFSGVTLVLMLQDMDVQRRRFRRYVKQIEELGRIMSKVTWSQMRDGFFIHSGWLYRMPDFTERPDLALHPELVSIRRIIRRNLSVVPLLV
jgi:hypothetical protein